MRYITFKNVAIGVIVLCLVSYFSKTNPEVLALPPSAVTTIANFHDCPVRRPTYGSAFPGERAMLSEDGSSVVLECADESILVWHDNDARVTRLGATGFFDAAMRQEIIPNNLICTNIISIRIRSPLCNVGVANGTSPFEKCDADNINSVPARGDDCEVLDSTNDRKAFVLRPYGGANTTVFNTTTQSSLALAPLKQAGVLLPRNGPPRGLVYIGDNGTRLQSLSLENGQIENLVNFPSRNSVWQNTESTGSSVAFSDAYQLLLTSFGGAFMGSQQITFVRAYTTQGEEKWNIRGNVDADKTGFSADNANVKLFADGKYATLSYIQRQTFFEIVDIGTGHIIGRVDGWPVGTSSKSNRIMIKTIDGGFSLVALKLK